MIQTTHSTSFSLPLYRQDLQSKNLLAKFNPFLGAYPILKTSVGAGLWHWVYHSTWTILKKSILNYCLFLQNYKWSTVIDTILRLRPLTGNTTSLLWVFSRNFKEYMYNVDCGLGNYMNLYWPAGTYIHIHIHIQIYIYIYIYPYRYRYRYKYRYKYRYNRWYHYIYIYNMVSQSRTRRFRQAT